MSLPESEVPTNERQPSQGGESFRWRIRLSDKAPRKRFGILFAAVFAMVLGWLAFRSPLLGIAGFAIILGSTAEYWLGTQYSIDGKGASARTGLSLVAMDWADVRRVMWEENGVRLSPLANAGTMDAFRGVFLRYGEGNREEIERAVLSFGGIHGSPRSGIDGGGDGGAGGESGAGDLPTGPPNSGDLDVGNE